MPRWALVLVVTPLVLCVGCAVLGYVVVWPRLRSSMSDSLAETMADSVFASLSDRIATSAPRSGELVIRPVDLDVNNAEVPGEAGFETGTSGTRIYGVVTEISPAGIALLLPGVTYSGVPVVRGGRVELTEIEAADNLLGFALTEEVFERSLEEGINRALDAHGLTPTAIALGAGRMTLQLQSAACPDGSGDCPTVNPTDHPESAVGLRDRSEVLTHGPGPPANPPRTGRTDPSGWSRRGPEDQGEPSERRPSR
jgi:hypothetical protein